ncbi:MAG: hypothetical protein ACRD16_06750 [Thermoanaerobaculia bacterium]
MLKKTLSVPQLIFIAGTRAALGAGVALLASKKLSVKQRKTFGWTLVGLGAATTLPAARILRDA